jgi:hypothetical protein
MSATSIAAADVRSAVTDKRLRARNGYGVLSFLLIVILLSLFGLGSSDSFVFSFSVLGLILFVPTFLVIALPGLVVLQPNESLVCLLFGRYAGTEHRSGLWWVNPLYSNRKVSRRLPRMRPAESE